MIGGHRYYFGKTGSAVTMTILTLTLWWVVGLGPLICLVWSLIDVFQIHNWLNTDHQQVDSRTIDMVRTKRETEPGTDASPAQY